MTTSGPSTEFAAITRRVDLPTRMPTPGETLLHRPICSPRESSGILSSTRVIDPDLRNRKTRSHGTCFARCRKPAHCGCWLRGSPAMRYVCKVAGSPGSPHPRAFHVNLFGKVWTKQTPPNFMACSVPGMRIASSSSLGNSSSTFIGTSPFTRFVLSGSKLQSGRRTSNGTRFSVTFSPIYKSGDEWKRSDTRPLRPSRTHQFEIWQGIGGAATKNSTKSWSRFHEGPREAIYRP